MFKTSVMSKICAYTFKLTNPVLSKIDKNEITYVGKLTI